MNTDQFWYKKRVFITGHTGFKGAWFVTWLSSLGAIVKGYSLPPSGINNLFDIACAGDNIENTFNDIRDYTALNSSLTDFRPEIIFHMAAQPLVLASYKNPIETYQVNVMGTANLLDAIRHYGSCRAIINITTDKCYENNGSHSPYSETDPMGGYDPYSSSKGCSELITRAYRRSFLNDLGVGVATARAGNVIGGGDWADNRLIPDILRSIDNETPVIIRNPHAVRPWQHVLEPLSGYMTLAERLWSNPSLYSGGWNFGPNEKDAKPVGWLVDELVEMFPNATWELEAKAKAHEAPFLNLDISKAKTELDWSPTWDLGTTLEKICGWHSSWRSGSNMKERCLEEIKQFMKSSTEK